MAISFVFPLSYLPLLNQSSKNDTFELKDSNPSLVRHAVEIWTISFSLFASVSFLGFIGVLIKRRLFLVVYEWVYLVSIFSDLPLVSLHRFLSLLDCRWNRIDNF